MTRPINELSDELSATILSGQSLSDDINLGGRIPVGLVMPAAWTAASITFQASLDDGATWHDVYAIDETELTISSVVVDSFLALDSANFLGVTYLRLRSGTTATPVNQGADRAITVLAAAHGATR